MNPFYTKLLSFLLWGFLAVNVQAQEKVSETVEKNIRSALSKVFDADFKIQTITKAPMGLYEIYADGKIFYTDSSVSYILNGDLIQVSTADNITQKRLETLTKIDFKKIPLASAIKYVKGKSGPEVAIIEDPNCIYCQKLHRDLVSKIDNITVYLFLIPILSNDSMVKTQNILCSPDPLGTWKNWMLNQKTPPTAGGCNAEQTAQINANIAFAKQLNVKGTPTVLFQNGRRIGGMPTSLEQFKELLLAK